MKQYSSLSSPAMLQLMKTFNKHYIHVLNCSVPAATTKMEILTVPLLPADLPLNDCRKSCGKIHQAFLLHFCILQAIKNWRQGRPENEATVSLLPIDLCVNDCRDKGCQDDQSTQSTTR